MPSFPLYIPTKGRFETMHTSRALTRMGVHHHLVVEPQEVDAYARAVHSLNLRATILPLDLRYKERYELCDGLGLSRSTGSGPARNFAWDHSVANGHARHWIMDDNIRGFDRLHNGERIKVNTPSFWDAMEQFVLRYTNVAMSGPGYSMFAITSNNSDYPPYVVNTRIYSCNLIRNDVPFRWRGRYNEDTILSLDMLKAGWCTIQFYAFLQKKIATQKIKGGNTTELYGQGTFPKSEMLVRTHPDVARLVWKMNRWHHCVDYSKFTTPLLRRRDAVMTSPEFALVKSCPAS